METQTIEPVQATRAAAPAAVAAYAGAAAFVIAAGWFWLATKNVTVAPPPRIGPHVLPLQGMRIYYRWQVTTLPQERYYTVIAIAGFICLAMAASYLRDAGARSRRLTRIGALLVGAGAATWITGSILQLGGHRAVGLMATHTNPIQTTNSIAFTIDMIVAAFALVAFAADRHGNARVRCRRSPRASQPPWASRMGRLHDRPRADVACACLVLRRRKRQPVGSDAYRRRHYAAAAVADLDHPHPPNHHESPGGVTCQRTRRRT